jgi:hypothetical protein
MGYCLQSKTTLHPAPLPAQDAVGRDSMSLYMVIENFRNKDAVPSIGGFAIADELLRRDSLTCRAG